MERAVAAAYAVCHENGLFAVFRQKQPALYDILILRQSGVLLFQGSDFAGDVLADGKRGNFYEGDRSEVFISAIQKRADAD